MSRRPRAGSVPPGAAVLDTDGVLIDSAAVHAAAWKTAFDACLAEWASGTARPEPFDADADYRRYVDGRSRYDGAAAFLAARGIRLPAGTAGDGPGCTTVRAVAARKEEAFGTALRARPVAVFEDARRALTRLRALGVPCAAVSASRHARDLLAAAGLDRLLTAVVDGAEAARLGLPGKPDPALFLHAARTLGARPRECLVVEDALAGVEAARRGRFGLVAGLDRTPDRHVGPALRERGADLVVADLTELLETVWGAAP
ncbi:HAD family hydrolase [Streptomyces sp. NPDC085529]|uniref:HAD family hydrolase n=1 Tax=Streptomyces sp. NPDC085529 TaxID=3365729 RepID=UPI0037D97D1F